MAIAPTTLYTIGKRLATFKRKNIIHVAGIIPISPSIGFISNIPLHDIHMPLSYNYTLVEHAVMTAASAGCSTIWIVADKESLPLARERVGDWVTDPINYNKIKTMYDTIKLKKIPVIYLQNDYCDFLFWSIIYGLNIVQHSLYSMSIHFIPNIFFIVSPFGVTDNEFILQNREKIHNFTNRFYCSFQKKSAKTGDYLPFTILFEDIKRLTDKLEEQVTTIKRLSFLIQSDQNIDCESFYGLKDMFNIEYRLNSEDTFLEVPWYFNVENWDDYYNCLMKKIKKPQHLYQLSPSFKQWHWHSLDEILEEERKIYDEEKINAEKESVKDES